MSAMQSSAGQLPHPHFEAILLSEECDVRHVCSSLHSAPSLTTRTTMRILTRTYRAFLGTPPASGSGSPRRTWPLRKPAAPEAATWAASWLWAAPSNHPERDLVSPCSEEETLETYTQAGDYKAAECLCMALSPSLCVRISPTVKIL